RKEIHRPMTHVHKWWATRLGSVFRTILLGALLEEGQDVWANYYRLHAFADKVVLDPFMGSGTTPGEALKLGCRVIGCDINPVSSFQVRKALQPVDVSQLRAAFNRVEARAAERVRSFYRTTSQRTGRSADVLYT